MTPTPPAALTGQDIGQAQNAVRAVLDALLARTATTFLQWVVVNVVATRGPRVVRDQLVDQVTDGLKVGEQAAAAAVADAARAGLIVASGDRSEVELTAAGEARHRQVRAAIAAITERLYGGLPADDLATAHRVLAIVTERANAELAS